jgi:xanthine dehydrogenase accessory factor
MLAPEPADILRFAVTQAGLGRRLAFATLVGISGSSSRALGSLMAVDDGDGVCGSLSSGCVDTAVVAEARSVIAEGSGRTVRFGEGSPYIDVRLPCGAGLDLLFTPVSDISVVAACLDRLDRREPASLVLSAGSGAEAGPATLELFPQLRIVVLGMGDELHALARLAATFGAEVIAVTPDEQAASALREVCRAVVETLTLGAVIPSLGDRWTAFVSVFHDRDWELALLPQVLRQDGFFHGAVGNERNRAARAEALAGSGMPVADLARLQGRIGLIPATRDPATLALSILAEVVGRYRTLGQPVLRPEGIFRKPG